MAKLILPRNKTIVNQIFSRPKNTVRQNSTSKTAVVNLNRFMLPNMNFENWIFERINSPYHEFFLEIASLYNEGKEPFLLNKSQWDMELNEPGRHVDPLLKKDDQGKLFIGGPKDNSLIPVHSVKWMRGNNRTDAAKGVVSHFMRDQPVIAAFSQSSPENMAATIIFVLLTIRGKFQQVMQDFPLIMLVLMGKFQFGMDEKGAELKSIVTSMESMLARKSPKKELGPAEKKTRVIRKGYGTGTTLFGWDRPFNKFRGISTVWSNRNAIYGRAMDLVSKKNTVGLFEYFLKTIPGLGAAKVGFVVQLIFGEMGCIDMHNINLYSQFYTNREGLRKSPEKTFTPDQLNARGQMTYDPATGEQVPYSGNLPLSKQPAAARNMEMYNKIKKVMKGNLPSKDAKYANNGYVRVIKNYMDVIEELEKDGINTIKLWDYWVSYVAHIYAQPDWSQPYASTGKMAGSTIDVNDPTDEKFLGTKDNIPDRNAIITQSKKFLWIKDKDGVYRPYYKGKLLGKKDNDFDYENEPEGGRKKKNLPHYKFKGIENEKGAGGASLAHHAVWWWRSKDYWYNLLKQAEKASPEEWLQEPPEGMRYTAKPKNLTASYLVAKPLAYLSLDIDLQNTIFPDEKEREEYLERLDDALGRLGFFTSDNWLSKIKSKVKKAERQLEKEAKEKASGQQRMNFDN